MYFATMDTGGISYSSLEYFAAGKTEAEAEGAILKEYLKRESDIAKSRNIKTVEDLNEWHGIDVVKLNAGECLVK
jgi:hypothetical protein